MKDNINQISLLTKEELCKREIKWECCTLACLSAIIHTSAVLSFNSKGISVIIESNNEDLFNYCLLALQALFGVNAQKENSKIVISGEHVVDILLELKILNSASVKTNNFTNDNIDNMLSVEEGIHSSLIESECCKASYLAGAFVGCGSITVLRGYHLEFSCVSKKLRDGLIWLLYGFGFMAGEATNRSGKHALYIKDKDVISDILVLMGAKKAMLMFSNLLAKRSLNQHVIRAANCDEANLNRLVNASTIQQDAINKLGTIKNQKLEAVAKARLKYPDHSYEELATILNVSKSTVKYRLNRLVQMANESNDNK